MDESGLSLSTRLNLETGRISWKELQLFFAKGQVIEIAGHLDLVNVATAFAQDNAHQCQIWLESGEVCRATDDSARLWAQNDSHLWAVVVAPWVLVQNRLVH